MSWRIAQSLGMVMNWMGYGEYGTTCHSNIRHGMENREATTENTTTLAVVAS